MAGKLFLKTLFKIAVSIGKSLDRMEQERPRFTAHHRGSSPVLCQYCVFGFGRGQHLGCQGYIGVIIFDSSGAPNVDRSGAHCSGFYDSIGLCQKATESEQLTRRFGLND